MGLVKLSETDIENMLAYILFENNITSWKRNVKLVISIWRRFALFVH